LKLGRKALLVIASGFLVIIIGSLGMVLFNSLGEKIILSEQLSVSRSQLQEINLGQLSSQEAELENRLTQAEAQLESVMKVLAEPLSSTTAATAIFEIADSYGLAVTEITSPGLNDENVAGANLQVVPLTAVVNGNVPDLVKFTTDLNRYFITGAVKTATITVPEGNAADNATASVQLVVYTYRGN